MGVCVGVCGELGLLRGLGWGSRTHTCAYEAGNSLISVTDTLPTHLSLARKKPCSNLASDLQYMAGALRVRGGQKEAWAPLRHLIKHR